MTTFVLPCLVLIAVSVYYANGGPPRRRIETSQVFGHEVDDFSETDCPWDETHMRRCGRHCYMEGWCAQECSTEAATRECHCSNCVSQYSNEEIDRDRNRDRNRDRGDSSSSSSSSSSDSDD